MDLTGKRKKKLNYIHDIAQQCLSEGSKALNFTQNHHHDLQTLDLVFAKAFAFEHHQYY